MTRSTPAAVYVAVSSQLLHPRAILGTVAALYVVTGWQTTRYTPAWLAWAPLWAALALVAGTVAAAAVVYPARLAVVVSGSAGVVAAMARTLAITREVIVDPPPTTDALASFVIAGACWLAVAVLLWTAYTAVLVPWSSVRHAHR
jgi:hypothetical protein